VTAVSKATYEQALARSPAAMPRALAELPVGWDRRDLEFLESRPATFADDGLVHLSYVGTLLPAGFETLRAVFAAVARLRATDSRRRSACACISSVPAISGRPMRRRASCGWPPSSDCSIVVTEQAPRLDYFDALAVLRDFDSRAAPRQQRTALHAEQSVSGPSSPRSLCLRSCMKRAMHPIC